jgi:electron transport complex protein RnfG
MAKQPEKENRFRESVTFQAILLGGSTLVATTLLSFGNLATRDQIALRLEEDLKASISQVIPADIYDNDLLESTITQTNAEGDSVLVYQAMKEDVVTAVIFEVSENGYSGEIRSIIAIAQDGKVLGVRVLAHTETPGLGDKIEVRKDSWILGFNGLSIDNPAKGGWAVRKDGGQFDQFTGATITPRAVVKSTRSGLEFFDDKKQVLLHVEAGPKQ